MVKKTANARGKHGLVVCFGVSNLIAMATNLLATASNLLVMASMVSIHLRGTVPSPTGAPMKSCPSKVHSYVDSKCSSFPTGQKPIEIPSNKDSRAVKTWLTSNNLYPTPTDKTHRPPKWKFLDSNHSPKVTACVKSGQFAKSSATRHCNKKLLETSASLLVTSALLLVTRTLLVTSATLVVTGALLVVTRSSATIQRLRARRPGQAVDHSPGTEWVSPRGRP